VKFGPDRGLAWKTKLPGKGCSTPILFGEHILLTAPIGDQDGLISYDLEGRKRWEVTVGQARGGKHQNGSGANPSAATDGQIIAVYFRSGNLACVDFDGKILWDANLQEHYGKDTLYWDLGTSPVLTSEHVVVVVMMTRCKAAWVTTCLTGMVEATSYSEVKATTLSTAEPTATSCWTSSVMTSSSDTEDVTS